jgi:hypothetical protein
MNYAQMDSECLYNRCLTEIYKKKGRLVWMHGVKDDKEYYRSIEDYEKKYMKLVNEIEMWEELLSRFDRSTPIEEPDE